MKTFIILLWGLASWTAIGVIWAISHAIMRLLNPPPKPWFRFKAETTYGYKPEHKRFIIPILHKRKVSDGQSESGDHIEADQQKGKT